MLVIYIVGYIVLLAVITAGILMINQKRLLNDGTIESVEWFF
jgi:hypothetical protein